MRSTNFKPLAAQNWPKKIPTTPHYSRSWSIRVERSWSAYTGTGEDRNPGRYVDPFTLSETIITVPIVSFRTRPVAGPAASTLKSSSTEQTRRRRTRSDDQRATREVKEKMAMDDVETNGRTNVGREWRWCGWILKKEDGWWTKDIRCETVVDECYLSDDGKAAGLWRWWKRWGEKGQKEIVDMIENASRWFTKDDAVEWWWLTGYLIVNVSDWWFEPMETGDDPIRFSAFQSPTIDESPRDGRCSIHHCSDDTLSNDDDLHATSSLVVHPSDNQPLHFNKYFAPSPRRWSWRVQWPVDQRRGEAITATDLPSFHPTTRSPPHGHDILVADRCLVQCLCPLSLRVSLLSLSVCLSFIHSSWEEAKTTSPIVCLLVHRVASPLGRSGSPSVANVDGCIGTIIELDCVPFAADDHRAAEWEQRENDGRGRRKHPSIETLSLGCPKALEPHVSSSDSVRSLHSSVHRMRRAMCMLEQCPYPLLPHSGRDRK